MCILSVDIGGTNTKWGIFEKQILKDSGQFESRASLGGRHLIERLCEKIPEILQDYPLEGITISSAGTIDSDKGIVLQASETIPGYQGMPVKEMMESAFHVPVYIENDVNCAIYAEAVLGAGKGRKSVFGLTLGTGVGSAMIINQEIYHGAFHFAGEVGYLRINGEVLDLSGSTRGLVQRVAHRKKEDLADWTGEKVFQAYKQNDVICQEEVERMCQAVAMVLGQCCCFLNPEMIVLGGAVLAQKDILLPLIKKSLKSDIPAFVFDKTEIAAAQYGNQAGIYGAYLLFIQHYPSSY